MVSATPIWLENPGPPRPPLEGAHACEIAVVGGGVTGVAAALFLARRGARVTLLERGTLAGGATGRNPGIVGAPTPHPYAIAAKAFGRERARGLWSLARRNRELVAASAVDCGWAVNGGCELAVSARERDVLRQSAAMLREDGFPAELDGDTLLHADYAELDPVRLALGLARRAEQAGAVLHERSPATLERVDPALLRTPQGELSASMVLLATNAHAAALAPCFGDVIVAMRAQMLATAPVAGRIVRAPLAADFGFEIVRQLPDGRVLACGGRRASVTTEYTLSDRPTDTVQESIERFLHERWPATRAAAVTHRWAGTIALTCDELPNVGCVPGAVNLYAVAGFHGRGMALALAAAELACGMMLDGRAPEAAGALSPRRHQM